MNKNIFNTLTITEQVDYINAQIPFKTLTKACSELGIARSTLSTRFTRNGYKLDTTQNKYVLITQYNNNVIELKHIEVINNEDEKKIKELIEILPDIKNIIKWFEEENVNNKNNNFMIEIDKFSGDIKNRTFILYESVLIKYNDFCNRHKEFKKQDLMSQALTEFIENHD